MRRSMKDSRQEQEFVAAKEIYSITLAWHVHVMRLVENRESRILQRNTGQYLGGCACWTLLDDGL